MPSASNDDAERHAERVEAAADGRRGAQRGSAERRGGPRKRRRSAPPRPRAKRAPGRGARARSRELRVEEAEARVEEVRERDSRSTSRRRAGRDRRRGHRPPHRDACAAGAASAPTPPTPRRCGAHGASCADAANAAARAVRRATRRAADAARAARRRAMFAPAPAGVVLISGFEIGAQLPDGRWLVMRQGRNWAEIGWIFRAALIIGGALAVLTLLAVLFARRLTRPIRNFSDAVQAVGVDPQSAPVREEGPQELRGAARAVNTMQARLRSLIADRTKTLAAVAHDMRTPLMRLRLAAENAPVEQRDRMAKEIGEVEALVASFIAFARDDPAEEARVRLDLFGAAAERSPTITPQHGRNVTFEGEERIVITGQSLGLKRLFSNLVENGLKYGGAARITLQREESAVTVDVADDGPGIPADRRESVFEPFVRLQRRKPAARASASPPRARSPAPMAATSPSSMRKRARCCA